MINKKLLTKLLFICIISQSISFCLLEFYTFPNEFIDKTNLSMEKLINLNYLNNHPKFNYLHGLWFMFTGIFIFCLIGLLEIPDRVNEIKMIMIKKILKK